MKSQQLTEATQSNDPVKQKQRGSIKSKQKKIDTGGLTLHMTERAKLVLEQVILSATNKQIKVSLNKISPTSYKAIFTKIGDLSSENARFLEVMKQITGASKSTQIVIIGPGEPGRIKALIGAYQNVDLNGTRIGSIDLMDMINAHKASGGVASLRLLMSHEIYENFESQVNNENKSEFEDDHKAALEANEYIEGISKLKIERGKSKTPNINNGSINFSYEKDGKEANKSIDFINNNVIKR